MRKNKISGRRGYLIPLAGLVLSIVWIGLIAGPSEAASSLMSSDQSAAALQSTDIPTPTPAVAPPKPCTDCHLDKYNAWFESPHAHAFDNAEFQEGWRNMEFASDCLLCHKAEYDVDAGSYRTEGVSCEACHGQANPEHPSAQMPVLSDEEYCGTCHPSTLGEARISGHSSSNEVRCASCHDPHSQQVLFENPNELCKDCHEEDLGKMDEALSGVHLQEEIACADCHTLDVPHTFVFNFQHEDTTSFFTGFDCVTGINESVANRVGTDHEIPGSYLQDQMNWPIVHRVSHPESTTQCSDCHVLDEELRSNFIALGFSPEKVDELLWESSDFPPLTEADLTKLVAAPKMNSDWIFWLVGVVAIFGIFDLAVARKLEGASRTGVKPGLFSIFRRRSVTKKEKTTDDQQGEE